MRHFWLEILVCTMMFAACGDDDSDFATRPTGNSSSACEDCDGLSSSKNVLSADSRDNSTSSTSSPTSSSTESSDSKSFSSSVKSSSSVSSSSLAPGVVDPSTVVMGEMTDSRDGQTYKTVTIGTQTWMAQNLNYESVNSFCYVGNASNCTKYGRLYTWAAAMDSVGWWSTNGKGCGYLRTCIIRNPARGICPEGWHVPAWKEWETLYSAMGSSAYAMQAEGFAKWPNATDAYAFSALPAGGNRNDRFSDEGSDAYFWSTYELNTSYTGVWHLSVGDAGIRGGYSDAGKFNGFSVRCVKD